jgi:hypothetical protein
MTMFSIEIGKIMILMIDQSNILKNIVQGSNQEQLIKKITLDASL